MIASILTARALRTGTAVLIAAASLTLVGCSSTPSTSAHEIAPTTDTRTAVADAAMQSLGRAYRAGATGPRAYDDSGLIYAAYRQVGAALPRDVQAQLDTGKPIELAQAEPADLVFFRVEDSQGGDRLVVGLYTQPGEMLMANPGFGGKSGVALFDIDDEFWEQRLVGVVRQLP